MNEDIKISVIVPSFNQGPYIENCIKSVLYQNYSNWELLIQDGDSQDSTQDICTKYSTIDKRIIFNTEKDNGFADAVNKALSIASGTLGIIQSSDDFFANCEVFKDVITIYNKNKKLEIIAGAAVIVNEKLELIETQERVEKFIPLENVFNLSDHFSQGATFFSIAKAKKINYLNTEVDMVADTDFWIRIACENPTNMNTILQTSKIWGAVTIQAEQRSSDLSKFYLARAIMAKHLLFNNEIELDYNFKLQNANNIIKIGIEHYKSLSQNINPFLKLYKELNNKEYKSNQKSNKLKSIVKFLLFKRRSFVINSKKEYYSSLNKPKIKIGWFL